MKMKIQKDASISWLKNHVLSSDKQKKIRYYLAFTINRYVGKEEKKKSANKFSHLIQ